MASLIWGSPFDKLLDKATSELLLEPDWGCTMECCDAIRQKDIAPKDALTRIRKKVTSKNPTVALLALTVLDTAMKNCGAAMHDHVCTHTVVDELFNVIQTGNDRVRERILELLQLWAHAFRNEPTRHIFRDTCAQLRSQGVSFPPLKESDAMFNTDTPPMWRDAPSCAVCHNDFSVLTRRKHHCRHCGSAVCYACSGKLSAVVKYGYEKPVRVCDPCFAQLNGRGSDAAADLSTSTPLTAVVAGATTGAASTASAATVDPQVQEREQDELEQAIALSLVEDAQARERRSTNIPSSAASPHHQHYPQQQYHHHNPTASPPPPATAPSYAPERVDDPELARYLDRDYWENERRKSEAERERQLQQQQKQEQQQQQEEKQRREQRKREQRQRERDREVQEQEEQRARQKAKEEAAAAAAAAAAATTTTTAAAGSSSTTAIVPAASSASTTVNTVGPFSVVSGVTEESTDQEGQVVANLQGALQQFDERLHRAMTAGRTLASDTALRTLRAQLDSLHTQLLEHIDRREGTRFKYDGVCKKTAQIGEMQIALGQARVAHAERVAAMQREQEMLQRMQLEQKMELLRQQERERAVFVAPSVATATPTPAPPPTDFHPYPIHQMQPQQPYPFQSPQTASSSTATAAATTSYPAFVGQPPPHPASVGSFSATGSLPSANHIPSSAAVQHPQALAFPSVPNVPLPPPAQPRQQQQQQQAQQPTPSVQGELISF